MRLLPRSLLIPLLLCITPRTCARDEPAEFYLHHRVIHPNLPATAWSEFGTVVASHLSPAGVPATFIPSESLIDDLSGFTENVDLSLGESLYQVAVERPGMVDTLWPVSIMKGPFALDYFVSSVSPNGACPSPSETPKSYPANNTTVLVKSPHSPPSPRLRAPPPLTPDGTPVAPVPEKSFLQKYWIYIFVVFAALMLSAPPEEPASNGNGRGAAR
ncbi:hypothetical protein ID866_2394 [Astraeus odoratus]|nr:hypothetical protein ID866_2394 [Astraeus odoratus]